jgi:preprotein translocase subunit SecA
MVSRAIRSAQTQVEQQNFEIRKNVLKYDEVMNKQRHVIYDERRKILEGEDVHEQVKHMINDAVAGYVTAETATGFVEEWNLERLWTALRTLYPISLSLEAYEAGRESLTAEQLLADVEADAASAYEKREESIGSELMREVERRVILSVVDRKWREHLYEMDYLQEGIGLRAMGARDPLVEYQREGYSMFQAMLEAIKEESVGFVFYVDVTTAEPEAAAVEMANVSVDGVEAAAPVERVAPSLVTPRDALPKGLVAPPRPANLQYSAPSIDGGSHVERTESAADGVGKVGRNDPCPCGSGKKYKVCHGAPGSRTN